VEGDELMTLQEAKEKIVLIENLLTNEPFILFHTFERNQRSLNLALTERLRKKTKKGRIWKSVPFLTALKNAEYGFDDKQMRSLGGSDGIFLIDRTFTPKNEMIRKIFDQYLDKPDSGLKNIAEQLGIATTQFKAVRLVSHHLRLLGVLGQKRDEDWIVLVDYDNTK
jgi:hypothetical protein